MIDELLVWGKKLAKELGVSVQNPVDRLRQELAGLKNTAVTHRLPMDGNLQGRVDVVEKFLGRGDVEHATEVLDNLRESVNRETVEAQRQEQQLAQLKNAYETNKIKLDVADFKLARSIQGAELLVETRQFEGADLAFKEIEASIKKGLEQDAHGNVRELAEKEDKLVKNAIQNVPEKAKTFQKAKFGERMAKVSGMPDVNWDEMIGDQSNAFDVISQMTVFDQGKDKLSKDSKPISYLNFQDAMYGDEPGSREKLVLAFYDKKLKTMDEEPRKLLEQAVSEMKSSEGKARTTAINKAFAAMGMKGVRPGVEDARNEIKGRLFLGKDNEAVNRGRVSHTLADSVLGFAAKALKKLQETDQQAKFNQLSTKVEELTQCRKEVDQIARESIGFTGKGEKMPEEMAKRDTEARDKLKTLATAAFEIMKDLDLGLDAKGWEKGGGIGSDDDPGTREVHEAQGAVFMGKNVNIRDDQSAASEIFRELGIPFTGGASGSTVDAVGGIVDALLGDDDDPTAALGEQDPRKAKGEAEVCMYIMGMHSAGHHSLVEMIYAAKQYPQKFFSQLRDPITDWVNYQEACSEFMKTHADLEKSPYAVLKDGKFDEKLSSAKRYEAMTKEIPESVVSHDECTKAFISHSEKLLSTL